MKLSVGPLGRGGAWSPFLLAPRGVENKPSLLCHCIILHCRIQEQCSNKEGREVWGLQPNNKSWPGRNHSHRNYTWHTAKCLCSLTVLLCQNLADPFSLVLQNCCLEGFLRVLKYNLWKEDAVLLKFFKITWASRANQLPSVWYPGCSFFSFNELFSHLILVRSKIDSMLKMLA